MAACTTTYMSPDYEVSHRSSAQSDDRNLRLMALQPQRRRGVCTPEFYFVKRIDNSGWSRRLTGKGAPDALVFRSRGLAFFAGDVLRFAALQRNRERLPRGVKQVLNRMRKIADCV